MRLPPEPWRFVIAWTLLCAIPVVFLLDDMLKPLPGHCIDYCGLGQTLGGILIPIIVSVWLVVVAIAVWGFRRQRH
jgi:hypothetical protein